MVVISRWHNSSVMREGRRLHVEVSSNTEWSFGEGTVKLTRTSNLERVKMRCWSRYGLPRIEPGVIASIFRRQMIGLIVGLVDGGIGSCVYLGSQGAEVIEGSR